MLDMQKNFGSFEKLLAESNAERDEMISQNKELKSSLSAAQALVETLKLKVA
jgi:3-methyladenine DNA glycosylase Tag